MMIEGDAEPHTVEAEAARLIMDFGTDASNSNGSGERQAGFQARNE